MCSASSSTWLRCYTVTWPFYVVQLLLATKKSFLLGCCHGYAPPLNLSYIGSFMLYGCCLMMSSRCYAVGLRHVKHLGYCLKTISSSVRESVSPVRESEKYITPLLCDCFNESLHQSVQLLNLKLFQHFHT